MITAFLTAITLAPALSLNIKVDGEGYLRFGDRGRVVYAKSARLVVDQDGRLSCSTGQVMLPSIKVPERAEKLGSDLEGHVSAVVSGEKKIIGRIVLACFEPGQQMSEKSGFLSSSARPSLRDAGEQTTGVIRVEGGNDASITKQPEQAPRQEAAPPATYSGTLKIELPESAMVPGDRILLGDIAVISARDEDAIRLKQIDLGPTPVTGATARISKESISAQIRKAGYLPSAVSIQMGATVAVSREGQKITQAQFLEAALKTIREKVGAAADGFSGDSTGPDFIAPKGKLELRTESMAPKDGLLNVVVAVIVDGKRLNSRTVKLTGEALTQGVKAGQTVKVRLVSSGYVAEISGRVRQNGILGQTVEVTIQYDGPNTTTSHSATVVGSGVVEVKL